MLTINKLLRSIHCGFSKFEQTLMKLQEFLKKNRITLNNKALNLCKVGLNKMKKAKDKAHGIDHIYHLFDNLDYLLSKDFYTKQKVNFEVLVLSICWHDVWISSQKTNSLIQMIYFQIVEGQRSAKIFDGYAIKHKLDILTKTWVKYVIRKHSSFQILPSFMIEAQILFDLDKIEMWNYKRFFTLNSSDIVAKKEFYQKYLVRFYLRYSEKMGLYFKTLEKVFEKNKKRFWKNING